MARFDWPSTQGKVSGAVLIVSKSTCPMLSYSSLVVAYLFLVVTLRGLGCSSGSLAAALALAFAFAPCLGVALATAFAFGTGIALDLDSSVNASWTLRCQTHMTVSKQFNDKFNDKFSDIIHCFGGCFKKSKQTKHSRYGYSIQVATSYIFCRDHGAAVHS